MVLTKIGSDLVSAWRITVENVFRSSKEVYRNTHAVRLAVLSKEMGPELISRSSMPMGNSMVGAKITSKFNGPETIRDAAKVATNLRVELDIIPIGTEECKSQTAIHQSI